MRVRFAVIRLALIRRQWRAAKDRPPCACEPGLATTSATPSQASVPSAPSGGAPAQLTITYEVRARGAVQADVEVFRRIAQSSFNDRRGWSLGGAIRFREVPAGGAFTLWLAEPGTLPNFAGICSVEFSCRAGRNVVINDARWRTDTAAWPTVCEYRFYVLNHELGHWLGLGHATCPSAGGRS